MYTYTYKYIHIHTSLSLCARACWCSCDYAITRRYMRVSSSILSPLSSEAATKISMLNTDTIPIQANTDTHIFLNLSSLVLCFSKQLYPPPAPAFMRIHPEHSH